uniref:Uncharacterized protein n=1 Tax=Arundo donax TaxID=35708 RepID=A0A0A9ERQ5_ARUDO
MTNTIAFIHAYIHHSYKHAYICLSLHPSMQAYLLLHTDIGTFGVHLHSHSCLHSTKLQLSYTYTHFLAFVLATFLHDLNLHMCLVYRECLCNCSGSAIICITLKQAHNFI